jgi:hypothetical protein
MISMYVVSKYVVKCSIHTCTLPGVNRMAYNYSQMTGSYHTEDDPKRTLLIKHLVDARLCPAEGTEWRAQLKNKNLLGMTLLRSYYPNGRVGENSQNGFGGKGNGTTTLDDTLNHQYRCRYSRSLPLLTSWYSKVAARRHFRV